MFVQKKDVCSVCLTWNIDLSYLDVHGVHGAGWGEDEDGAGGPYPGTGQDSAGYHPLVHTTYQGTLCTPQYQY